MLSSRILLSKSSRRFHQLTNTLPVISRRSMATIRDQTNSSSNNIIKSSFTDIPSVEGVLVPELIRSVSGKWENLTAYECAVSGLKYTHKEVLTLGRNFGAALLKSGLKKGDVAAVLLPNCPQYAVIFNGMLETGIIPSLMNPLYTPAEVESMLLLSKAKCVVTVPMLHPLIQAVENGFNASGQKSTVKLVVSVPFGPGDTPDGWHGYGDMIRTDASAGTEFLQGSMSHVNPAKDTALILWSSGTSGPPKGVMLTHHSLATQLHQVTHEAITNYKAGEETFVGLAPFFHTSGSVAFLSLSLFSGAKVVTVPKFEPALFTQTMKAHKFTVTHLVPPLVGFLVSNPALVKADLSSLHTVACGGAPAGSNLIQALLGKFGDHITFQEAYGLTETTGISHKTPVEAGNNHLGSIGKVMPGASSKIIDVDTGEALGPGEKGEICFKGDQVMKGYLDNEEATKNTIDSEGWLHTGDIGIYNEQGYFHVVDRLKELIKVKGFQVAPSELEDVLRKHPKIADIGIIGIPHERDGESPRAFIVAKDSSLSEKEIHEFLQDKVAAYKQLKGGVEFVKEIPKSASGKILRRVLLSNFNNSSKYV